MVTHDPKAAEYASKVFELEKGKIIQEYEIFCYFI